MDGEVEAGFTGGISQLLFPIPNATPSFSGRISAVKWMTVDGNLNKTNNERSYVYNYDLLNRVTSANYAELVSGGTTFNTNAGAFNESGITYDENGNILNLNRNAMVVPTGSTIAVEAPVDNLTYSYSTTIPNQLNSVTDNSGTYATGYGFKNITGTTSATGYQYAPSGNLVSDAYKGITIGYNVLNKTDNIQMVMGPNNSAIAAKYRYINYTYDASGNLIRKQQYDNNNVLITTTDYIDGFVYITPGTTAVTALSYFPMAEGRVVNTGNTLTPEFIITDQQGNAPFQLSAQRCKWDHGHPGKQLLCIWPGDAE